jgi:DNA-binding response OmpR family regulator
MRLLIVKDEPDLLSSLAGALRDDGYAVDEAADGEDGLAKALHCEYDAIVLDVMLPWMSGFAVLDRLRVRKKTPALMLTAREIALIEYLAQHRGLVITRERLYEHLFDENDSTLSNLLDVHVSNVRKKLGHEFIFTRRGLGYCIE